MRALQIGVVGAALLCDPSVTGAHFKLLGHYHCADVQITADPAKPISAEWR